MTVFGWDASNWDDPIRVRDGIDFYTHKLGEGHRFYYDRECHQSLANARDLDVPILGAYFVNHPGDQDDQADWFVALLDQDVPWWREHPCFVLQIDAEKFDYMARAPSLDEIQAFGDRLVHAHGLDPRRVLAYAPRWLYGDSLIGLTYRLWASDYGANPVAHYRDAYPGDDNPKSWRAYSGQTPLILQYGSNTTIGDQTTCDANAYRGTLQQLLAELGGGDMPLTKDDVTANWTSYLAPPGPASPNPGDGYNMQDHLLYAEAYAKDARDYAKAALDAVKALAEALQVGGGNPDTAAILARIDDAEAAITAETRDAVADLGEGGAAQVRADPDA